MNLFVTNLDKSVTLRDLRAAFEDYGTIVTTVVMSDDNRPYSRVQLQVEPDDGARAAIEELNQAPLRGRPIKVREWANIRRNRRIQVQAVAIERRKAHERRTA